MFGSVVVMMDVVHIALETVDVVEGLHGLFHNFAMGGVLEVIGVSL